MDYYKKVCKLLYSYSELQSYKKNLQLDLSLLTDFHDLKGINYDRLSIRVYDVVKSTENNAINKIELETSILKEIHSVSNSISKIENGLKCLDKYEYKIIESYYFNNDNLTDIAEKLRMSESTVGRIRKKAIYKMSNSIYGTDLILN